jgi:cobalamin transport system substrate-binding protein
LCQEHHRKSPRLAGEGIFSYLKSKILEALNPFAAAAIRRAEILWVRRLKMHRLWLMLVSLILVLAIVPLTACDDNGNEESEMPEQSVSLAPGNTEILNGNEESGLPERIISLAPGNTEILFALGLGDKVVGVTDYCNYPPEALEKPKVGGFSTVDIEKVLSLAPDLILAANIHIETVVPELERRGLRVVTLNPQTIDEVLTSITQVGALTGTEAKASQLVNEMRGRIEAVTDRVSSFSDAQKPRVFCLTWQDPIWTAGHGTFMGDMIEEAGGKNIFGDVDGNKTVDLETVITRNPQVILVDTGMGSSGEGPFNWAKNEDRLKGTDARMNNRIYSVDSDLIDRPGPRIVDGLELIAKCIHPEIFGEPGETK